MSGTLAPQSPQSKQSAGKAGRAAPGLGDGLFDREDAMGAHPVEPADTRPAVERVGLLGWLAGGALLVLVGMIAGASLWLYAAYAAVAVAMVNHLLATAWSTKVIANRKTGPLEVEVGAIVPIGIEVTNTGSLPVAWILLEDLLPRKALMYNPPALGLEGGRLRLMMLWPKQRQLMSYTLKCNRRGYYQIGPAVLETGDLMGLGRRYRVGAEPQYLLVMPKVVPLSGYDVASRRPIGEIRITDMLMDDPTRLRGIRQWQPGDPLRQVHWAATARTGTLHSKIYEPTSVAGATVVLDLHTGSNPAHHEPVRSDLAVTMAASIAGAMYELSQPIGLVTNGRDAADRIRTEGWDADFRTRSSAQTSLVMREQNDRLRPIVVAASTGPVHQKEIQRSLARLELSDGLSLGQCLIEAESRLARDTTLVVILQQTTEESAAAILGMSRRGWSVAVIVNAYDREDFAVTAGPFISYNIPVMQLVDEASVSEVCRRMVMR